MVIDIWDTGLEIKSGVGLIHSKISGRSDMRPTLIVGVLSADMGNSIQLLLLRLISITTDVYDTLFCLKIYLATSAPT